MALPRISVKNAAGDTVDVNTPNSGRKDAVDSQASVLCNEDFGKLTALETLLGRLPAGGAASAAKQDTGNTSLASIDAKLPAPVGGALPVNAVLTGQTGALLITANALPLPTGAATSAAQATGNTSLANIDGKVTAIGLVGDAAADTANPGANASAVSLLKGIFTRLLARLTVDTVVQTAYTDRSGTVATAGGGGFRATIAANAARRGLSIQNTSSGDLRVNPGGPADNSTGYLIKSGDCYNFPPWMVPTGAIGIWGATTGQAFTAYEV